MDSWRENGKRTSVLMGPGLRPHPQPAWGVQAGGTTTMRHITLIHAANAQGILLQASSTGWGILGRKMRAPKMSRTSWGARIPNSVTVRGGGLKGRTQQQRESREKKKRKKSAPHPNKGDRGKPGR